MRNAVLTSILTLGLAATAHAEVINAHAVSTTPRPEAAGCQLQYGGGPLIQHVKVVTVFYSPVSNYGVSMLDTQLATWYAGVTASAHFDMLSEYNVTNYKISRGTYLMSFIDTNANPSTTKTLDPETYLKGLLSANKLPKPDDDTIYMMYFPSHVDPTLQGSPSCISGGGFCAYHNSYTDGTGQLVRYGVMPDTTAGSCAGGCGPAGFNGVCDVSSHELVEAVTDPDNNSAWVDQSQQCGEIGDICAGSATETGIIPGTNFTVQKEWSNKLGMCAVNNPNIVVNDFTLGAPNTVTIPQGGMATTTITTTKVGMAENVTLATAMAPPTGIVVSFNPTSITSDNGMSTITISAAATATLGMGTFTVKATDAANNTHTQAVAYNVVPPPDMAMSPDMAQGGGGGNGGGGSGGSGGNGNHPGQTGGCGCVVGGTGGGIGAGWAAAAIFLLAFALRRRRA